MDPNAEAAPQRVREAKHRKAEILEAAEEIFRRKGYRSATTDEIARESGFSVGTLYNLFGDKEGLYAEVLERIGAQVLSRLSHAVLSKRDPEEAIEALITLRLCNYVNDRLFFQPFSSDGEWSLPLERKRLSPRIVALYKKYLDAVAGLFKRAMEREGLDGLNPAHLALSLEGLINAFMGYWSRPRQSDSLSSIARHIRDLLLSPVDLRRAQAQRQTEDGPGPPARTVHMSRFDMERLRELIVVARGFGDPRRQTHLDELLDALDTAKLVNPKEVPPDLVTMNSRVLLRDVDDGRSLVCRLVFPKDVEAADENVSILEPLGTALLGNRASEVFEVRAPSGAQRYQVVEIIYQPEASGDYHL